MRQDLSLTAAAAHLEACHQLASDPLDARHPARCFTGHTILPLLITGTQLGVFLDGLDLASVRQLIVRQHRRCLQTS